MDPEAHLNQAESASKPTLGGLPSGGKIWYTGLVLHLSGCTKNPPATCVADIMANGPRHPEDYRLSLHSSQAWDCEKPDLTGRKAGQNSLR